MSGGGGVDAALENAVLDAFSSAGWFKGWPSGSKALSRQNCLQAASFHPVLSLLISSNAGSVV